MTTSLPSIEVKSISSKFGEWVTILDWSEVHKITNRKNQQVFLSYKSH